MRGRTLPTPHWPHESREQQGGAFYRLLLGAHEVSKAKGERGAGAGRGERDFSGGQQKTAALRGGPHLRPTRRGDGDGPVEALAGISTHGFQTQKTVHAPAR